VMRAEAHPPLQGYITSIDDPLSWLSGTQLIPQDVSSFPDIQNNRIHDRPNLKFERKLPQHCLLCS
jgi:hypothetical protein